MKQTMQPTTNPLSSPGSDSSLNVLRFAPNSLALGLPRGSEDDHVFASYSCDRDGHRCGYCNRYANTIDHVMPRSRGGRNVWENVVAACGPCNHSKASRTPKEAGMRLIAVPAEPRSQPMFSVFAGAAEPGWAPWLGLSD